MRTVLIPLDATNAQSASVIHESQCFSSISLAPCARATSRSLEPCVCWNGPPAIHFSSVNHEPGAFGRDQQYNDGVKMVRRTKVNAALLAVPEDVLLSRERASLHRRQRLARKRHLMSSPRSRNVQVVRLPLQIILDLMHAEPMVVDQRAPSPAPCSPRSATPTDDAEMTSPQHPPRRVHVTFFSRPRRARAGAAQCGEGLGRFTTAVCSLLSVLGRTVGR